MASAFCTHCATYGHFTESCVDAPSYEAIEPVYLGQVSSATDANVRARIAPRMPPVKTDRVVELQDNNTAIRAFLIESGVPPTGKIRENYRLVQKWAASVNQKVVYTN